MNKFIVILALVAIASIQADAGLFSRRMGSFKGGYQYQAPQPSYQTEAPALGSSAQHFEAGVKGYQGPVKRSLPSGQYQESISYEQGVKGGYASTPAPVLQQAAPAPAPVQVSYQEPAAPVQVAQAEPLPVQSTYQAPAVESVSYGVKGTHAAPAPVYQQAPAPVYQAPAPVYQAPAPAPVAVQSTYQEAPAPVQTVQAEAPRVQSFYQTSYSAPVKGYSAPVMRSMPARQEFVSYEQGVKGGYASAPAPVLQQAAPAPAPVQVSYQEPAAPVQVAQAEPLPVQSTYQAPAAEPISYSYSVKSGHATAPIEPAWRKN